mgnify:CR=1 FL=1
MLNSVTVTGSIKLVVKKFLKFSLSSLKKSVLTEWSAPSEIKYPKNISALLIRLSSPFSEGEIYKGFV